VDGWDSLEYYEIRYGWLWAC